MLTFCYFFGGRRQWKDFKPNQAVCHQLLYSQRGGGGAGGGPGMEFARTHPKVMKDLD